MWVSNNMNPKKHDIVTHNSENKRERESVCVCAVSCEVCMIQQVQNSLCSVLMRSDVF